MEENKKRAVVALQRSLRLGGTHLEQAAFAGLTSGVVVVLGAGTRTTITLTERAVQDAVSVLGETRVLFGHSHPDGMVVAPSLEDLTGTRAIGDVLRRLSVELVEHVIVGGDGEPYLMAEEDPDLWQMLLRSPE